MRDNCWKMPKVVLLWSVVSGEMNEVKRRDHHGTPGSRWRPLVFFFFLMDVPYLHLLFMYHISGYSNSEFGGMIESKREKLKKECAFSTKYNWALVKTKTKITFLCTQTTILGVLNTIVGGRDIAIPITPSGSMQIVRRQICFFVFFVNTIHI